MSAAHLEHRIARLLAIGTYLAVAVLIVGVGLAVIVGREGDLGRIDLLLYAGLAVVILTPVARVAAAATGFAARGERELTAIALAVLGVIGLTVIVSWMLA